MKKTSSKASKVATKSTSKKEAKASRKIGGVVAKAANHGGTFQNPFRQLGGYWASVEALRALGIGKMHSHDAILPAVKKAMGENWKPFAAKKGKLTAEQRALLNVMVTSRSDYGKPLNEVGYEVRWDGREKKAGLFKVGK